MKDMIRLKQITRHYVNKCNKIPGHEIKSAIKAIECLTKCVEKVDAFVKSRSAEVDKMNKEITEK